MCTPPPQGLSEAGGEIYSGKKSGGSVIAELGCRGLLAPSVKRIGEGHKSKKKSDTTLFLWLGWTTHTPTPSTNLKCWICLAV